MKVTDWIGWTATAVFLASYACRDPRRLRLVQGGAALLWAFYGVLIAALPVVLANALVAMTAVYSSLTRRRDGAATVPPPASIKPASGPGLSRTS